MQVKCTSCGAPQEVLEENKCNYCGISLENSHLSTDSEIQAFNLALFEYKKGDFTKSILLFDEILKSNPNFYLGWVHKIFSSFLNNLLQYNKDYHRLFSQASKSFNLKDFNNDIEYLLNNFNTPNNTQYLEKNLLILFSTLINSDYTKLAGKDSIFEKNIFSLCKNANQEFLLFLNNISNKFSSEFKTELLKIISDYFDKKGFNDTIPGFFDLETNFDIILSNNLSESRKFIAKILDLYANSIKIDVDRQLNNYSKDKSYKLFLPSETKFLRAFDFIERLRKKSPEFDFNACSVDYKLKIDAIKSTINSTSIKNGGKKECFIATATMGNYNHPVVIDLRLFRDNWLLQRKWGLNFTNWYYKYGPWLAKVIEKSIILRKIAYILIVKPLQIITKNLR